MSEHKPQAGMSVAQATRLEYAIIAIGLLALLMIFQPFSLALFSCPCASRASRSRPSPGSP